MGIMKEICIRVLRWTLELIDVLVKKEIFKTRSEFKKNSGCSRINIRVTHQKIKSAKKLFR